MRISYKPSAVLGAWSVRLIALALAFFILFAVLVALGQRGGETFFSNLVLTIPILIAAILAVCAFFTGILSIIRNRERAVFVLISTAIGFFVLIFGLAEITFPH